MNLLVCFCNGKTEACVFYLLLAGRRLLKGMMAQLSHFLSIDIYNEVMYCLLYNLNRQPYMSVQLIIVIDQIKLFLAC